ncbi:unnamed protein product [Cuscuta epithymum]|uniref:Uncharacterized protein n=1 Tax=Cuscuta epithymum TaxID=186058 RepID=A0AAV0G0G8_9ASTE|nr:unnamed protein product [Cuscuta epithymum]
MFHSTNMFFTPFISTFETQTLYTSFLLLCLCQSLTSLPNLTSFGDSSNLFSGVTAGILPFAPSTQFKGLTIFPQCSFEPFFLLIYFVLLSTPCSSSPTSKLCPSIQLSHWSLVQL